MRELAGLHPNLRPSAEAAVEYAIQSGVRPTITSVTRTWANQDRLYRNWLKCQESGAAYSARSLTPGLSCRYPANAPGYSSHQYGFSWDSVVPAEYVSWWVAVREAFGWRVPPNDLIHAELPDWPQYADPALLY